MRATKNITRAFFLHLEQRRFRPTRAKLAIFPVSCYFTVTVGMLLVHVVSFVIQGCSN
jgi:hypothetical protein